MISKSIFIIFISIQILKTDVVGIDFGSEFYKAAIIKPRKAFEMVENEFSKRKSVNAICFINDERIFDIAAYRKGTRTPSNIFFMMNKYFGIKSSNDYSKLEDLKTKYYEDFKLNDNKDFVIDNFNLPNFEHINSNDKQTNDTIKEKIDNDNSKLNINYYEVTSMILNNLKKDTDKFAESPISDAVVTIPPKFTINQRVDLLNSFALTNFNLLGFVHENTGASVYHAMGRNDVNKTHNSIILNIGSQSVKLSYIQYTGFIVNNKTNEQAEDIKVIYDDWDNTVGGYNFDVCIANILKEKYDSNDKHKKKINNNLNVMRRLIIESIKVKEVLSANQQAGFNIQEIFEDVDFYGSLKRDEFEDKCSGLFEQINNFVKEFISKNNININDINDIQAIGGSIRIPKIQEDMKNIFGKSLSFNINGDDSMAQGASFIAANFSSSFKVKKIYLSDGPNYEVKIKIKELNEDNINNESPITKELVVFPKKSNYGSKKALSLIPKENLNIELITIENGIENKLLEYNIENIKNITLDSKYENCTDSKLVIGVTLDHFGLPSLHSSYIKFEEIVQVKVENLNNTNTTDIQYKNKTKKYQAMLEPKLVVNNLKFISENDRKLSLSLLNYFEESEKIKKKNSESKNMLESVIYKIRDLINDIELKKFIKDEEVVVLDKTAADLEEWFFSDEAFNSNYTVFDEKYNNVSGLLVPIDLRKKEYSQREEVFKRSRKYLEEINLKLHDIKKYRNWISEEEINKSYLIVDNLNSWLNKTESELSESELFNDPIVYNSEIVKKVKKAEDELYRLRAIKKPANNDKNKTEENLSQDDIFNNMDFSSEDFLNKLKNMNLTDEQIEELKQNYQRYNSTNNSTTEEGKTDNETSSDL